MTEKSVLTPSLLDLFLDIKTDIFRTMNCVKVGKVTKFDATKKTVEVQVQFRRVLPDGSTPSYPLLLDCPVFTLQGGGAAIQLPIAAGDYCIVLFSDRNIDAWFRSGNEAAPFDARCHDLSDGIALVGIEPLTTALAAYSTTEARMTYGGAKVGESGGKVTIANQTTTLLTVINGLIDVIKALTAGGHAIDVPAQATLETYKTTVATLLY